MYCTKNCTPISASPPTISHRDRLHTASRFTFSGISRMSAEHISTISITMDNCSSFILVAKVRKKEQTAKENTKNCIYSTNRYTLFVESIHLSSN